MKSDQLNLLGIEEVPSWEDEWDGMPEFIQGDMGSIASVMVHFECINDMKEFSDLVGQNITFKTVGIFYPKTKTPPKKVYVDES